MIDRNALAPYAALLTGHDAGFWRLPDPVLRARKAGTVVAGRRNALRAEQDAAEPLDATAQAGASIVDLATAGRKVPDHPGEPLAAIEDRRRVLAADEAVLAEAERLAAIRFRDVLRDSTDAIVRDALRPAFEAVVGTAHSLAPILSGVNLQSGGWSASEAERLARESLRDLMPRWLAILDAHSRLLGIDRESRWYSPVRSIDAVYPKRTMIAGRIKAPPWPADQGERLLWYVSTEGVDLWLPTLAEEREAYEAAEAAKPKMPVIFRPTLERPRSPQRPVLNLPGVTSRGQSRVRITTEAPPE